MWHGVLLLVKNLVEMILCSGLDMECACVYVCVCVRERDSRDTRSGDTENRIHKLINKGEKLNYIQGGRRVLYIVTLSLH